MTNEEILRAAGGVCVAGDLIIGHTVVGQYRGGEFLPTMEGFLKLEDLAKAKQAEVLAVVKEVVEPEVVAPPTRRGRRAPPPDQLEIGDVKL